MDNLTQRALRVLPFGSTDRRRADRHERCSQHNRQPDWVRFAPHRYGRQRRCEWAAARSMRGRRGATSVRPTRFRWPGRPATTYSAAAWYWPRYNPYWTFAPTFNVAYLSKDWKIAVNGDYEFHTASRGNTGVYAGVASNTTLNTLLGAALTAPNGCVGFQCPGIGWTSGQQLFIDWSAEYKWGKWSFGPAGDFKFQTTADTPGSGWTCAELAASPVYGPTGLGLGCGKATDISLGGILGYDLGGAELQTWVVDSVYNKDDFDGLKIFTRLSFKLGGPPPAPMATKAPQ